MMRRKLLTRPWIVGLAGVVVASVIVAIAGGDGNPAENVRMLPGTAWVSSGKVGQLTLLDGTSAEVSAQVQVAPAGKLVQFSITVQIEGHGQVSSDKFPTCSPPGCAHYLDMGTNVLLSAIPQTGEFLGWSGGWCGGMARQCQVEANFENKIVIARFT